MKFPCLCATLLLAGSTASATTIVVFGNATTCTSSPDAAISVTQRDRSIDGARVDVYREIENGERAVWSGTTDSRGMVKPAGLSPGKYRVFVDSGKVSGVVALTVVTNNNGNAEFCKLEFAPPPKPQSQVLAELAKNAPSIQLRQFRGVVQDENGAVIPRVKITVFRKGAFEKSVAEIESGAIDQPEVGQFWLSLSDGDYVAFFDGRGFRKRAINFETGQSGWNGFGLTMIVAGSSTQDPSPMEWTSHK